MRHFCTLLLTFLLTGTLTAQSIVINEFMASNSTTIPDEDGDFSDWIELFNPGDAVVSLEGWGISDNLAEPYKWTFPAVSLEQQQHLLLFASDKDRDDWIAHWETVIDWGDEWHYFVGHSEPPAVWRELGFDDSGWPSGPSGFGYGDGDDATGIPPTMSVYTRCWFGVDDPTAIRRILLHVDWDDAFVAYLNGVEITRANIGEPGVPPPHDQGAVDWREAEIYRGGLPMQFNVEEYTQLLQVGTNLLAIQTHNQNIESSDLTIIPFLTLGMDAPPPDPQGVPEILQGITTQLHTNFRIAADGEPLLLTGAGGETADSLHTAALPGDISYGRQPDGDTEWYFFETATPGGANDQPGYNGIATAPVATPPGGFFNMYQLLTLSGDSICTLHYTLDCTLPTPDSPVWSEPLPLAQSSVVRAAAFAPGYLPSPVITHSYIFNAQTELPRFCLVTDPGNLWDPDTGIYTDEHCWEEWERPVHVSFYEEDPAAVLSQDAGMRIYGGWTRNFPQKSLSLFARGAYGPSEFGYRFFPDREINSFEALLLRNSGNDWCGEAEGAPHHAMMCRDGLMTSLIRSSGIDLLAYRPTVVYLNGEYWGIHNLREKINEHYLAAHHEVDPDDLDLLEFWGEVINGNNLDYLLMMEFIETHDLALPENYAEVAGQIDIDEFIDFNLCQIYFANTDWPGNNVKYWRPHSANARWRWIMYDTDFGFGLVSGHMHNTLAFALEESGPDWPNPPWSTLLLRSLIDNTGFRDRFINRFCFHASTLFEPEAAQAHIDTVLANIEAEMPYHTSRWGGNLSVWEETQIALYTFAAYRLYALYPCFRDQFDLASGSSLTVDRIGSDGCTLLIEDLQPVVFPWSGNFFNELPIRLEAVPAAGWHFSHWQETGQTDSLLALILSGPTTLTAVFEPGGAPGPLVINEINYHSADDFNPEDWIELFNTGASTIQLAGWEFRDEEDTHSFSLPELELTPGGYLVLCRDTTAFNAHFPQVTNRVGELDFGLSGDGELVRLYDPEGILIDSLVYDDVPPWPAAADGDGPTLELLRADYNNALPTAWQASTAQHGTPGALNSVSGGVITDLDIAWSGGAIILYWSAVPTAEIYRIYASDQPYFEVAGLTPVATCTGTTCTLLPGGTYGFYRVTWE